MTFIENKNNRENNDKSDEADNAKDPHIQCRTGHFFGILRNDFAGMLDSSGVFLQILSAIFHIGIELLDLAATTAAKKRDDQKQYPHYDTLFAILFFYHLSARRKLFELEKFKLQIRI